MNFLEGRISLDGELDVSRAVENTCLAVFDEESQELLATTQIDKQGWFSFTDLPNGKYRLVIRFSSGKTCAFSLPIKIDRSSTSAKGLFIDLSRQSGSRCKEVLYDFELKYWRNEFDPSAPFESLKEAGGCSKRNKRILYMTYLDSYAGPTVDHRKKALSAATRFIELCKNIETDKVLVEYFEGAIPELKKWIEAEETR